VSLKILRDKQVEDVEIVLGVCSSLVPVHLYDVMRPQYYIFAGLVFVPLSEPYLESEFGKDWRKKAPVDLVYLARWGYPTTSNEQVVLLADVLADEINVGYLRPANLQLVSVNGIKVINLRHLVEIIETSTDMYISFKVVNPDRVLVVEREWARKANARILKQNAISSDKSPDLLNQLEPHKPPSVFADSQQTGPEGSLIEVVARDVTVTVSDTGDLLEEEELEKIGASDSDEENARSDPSSS